MLTTCLRTYLMSTYREHMPPLSYLTLLDIVLLVNLSLVACCILVIVSSAVTSQNCYYLIHMQKPFNFISLFSSVYETVRPFSLG